MEHYRIIYGDNKLTIDEESYFENLPELVEVYFLRFPLTALRLITHISSRWHSAIQGHHVTDRDTHLEKK